MKIIDDVVPKREIEEQIIQILKKNPQKNSNMGLLNSTLKMRTGISVSRNMDTANFPAS